MANLHFHYGTMGASKSAQLIITAYNFRKNGNPTDVIKPITDTRFGATTINSRIGLSVDAVALPDLSSYTPLPDIRVILVDEVQFFQPSDIDRMVDIADNSGRIIMCYGLMVDSNENLFPASARLVAVGAKLHRMESNCQMPGCLNLATHHLRFDSHGNVIHNGDAIALGDDNYKSVCRRHYNEMYHSHTR
ncbi:MAG: hypothetical protein IJ560_00845 [Alphaproteobacteria bacterium]|nr:hypothetical protein [Alphaproteobacteria bacterium]